MEKHFENSNLNDTKNFEICTHYVFLKSSIFCVFKVSMTVITFHSVLHDFVSIHTYLVLLKFVTSFVFYSHHTLRENITLPNALICAVFMLCHVLGENITFYIV